MKKLIALLMVCGFAMSFIACGGGSQSEADSETETPAMEPAPSEPAPAEADTTAVPDSTTVQ
jgi:hypothetical protein